MPSNFRRVFTSSVGTKLLIGLTGLALFAYLVLGEHVEARDLLGIIPVALGIYLVTRPAKTVA